MRNEIIGENSVQRSLKMAIKNNLGFSITLYNYPVETNFEY